MPHTPGPWRATRWMEDQSTARVLGPAGETLATIHDAHTQGAANQDLIAAAPDLLNACQLFKKWMQFGMIRLRDELGVAS